MRFSKISAKSEFFDNFTKIEFFSNISNKIEIFGKSLQNRECRKFPPKSKFFKNFSQNHDFEYFDENRDFFLQISTKIEIFCAFRPKSRFSRISTQNEIFAKFWPKSRFSRISTLNKILAKFRDFWQISTKIEIFENFDKIKIFRKFRPNSRFSQISTKIEIFAKFDQNRDYLEISTKIEGFFWQFRPKSETIMIRLRTTLKFWSTTIFGAAAQKFGSLHKFELPTVIADTVPRATRVVSLASVGHVTAGHSVSHMVPIARCRPPCILENFHCEQPCYGFLDLLKFLCSQTLPNLVNCFLIIFSLVWHPKDFAQIKITNGKNASNPSNRRAVVKNVSLCLTSHH